LKKIVLASSATAAAPANATLVPDAFWFCNWKPAADAVPENAIAIKAGISRGLKVLCIDISPVVIVVGMKPGLVKRLELKQTFEILFDQKYIYTLL
jgi:hypothetical protein